MKTPVAALAVITALGLEAAGLRVEAAEAQFTLTVPVRLTNMPPEITVARVVCIVGPDTMPSDGEGASGAIGSASSPNLPIDPNSGALSQNIVLAINAGPGKDPNAATKYKCLLYIVRGAVETTFAGWSIGAPYPLGARPGTPFVPIVSGGLRGPERGTPLRR